MKRSTTYHLMEYVSMQVDRYKEIGLPDGTMLKWLDMQWYQMEERFYILFPVN